MQALQQGQVLQHAGLVVAKIHFIQRTAVHAGGLAQWRGKRDGMTGIEQLLDRLQQFVGIETGAENTLLAQLQLHLVRQHDQHLGSLGCDGSQPEGGGGAGSTPSVLSRAVGRLEARLGVPTTDGHYRLPMQLRTFMERHPQLAIELSINNRNVDLVAEGYDMAIRLGELADSGLVAKRLGDEELCLVASPAYLRLPGAPRTLDELGRHACLPFILPSTGCQAPWLLRVNGLDMDWLAPPRRLVADDVLGAVSLAQQGLGICQTYHFVAEERLANGQLVEVLPEWRGRSRPFSLRYPPHRRMSAACRALIDRLPGRDAGILRPA